MIKQAPSLLRIVAMVVFALSCLGLLLFLWLAFGGPIPLKPEGYRFKVEFPEAATLGQEADVRMAGVNVGKVRRRSSSGAARGRASRSRSKWVRPDPEGHPRDPAPEDAARRDLRRADAGVALERVGAEARRRRDAGERQVEPTVELDEIFSIVRRPTREASRSGSASCAKIAAKGGEESQRGVRQPRPVRGRRSEAAEGAGPAARPRGPAGEEHGRGVRGDQRAPGRAARADRRTRTRRSPRRRRTTRRWPRPSGLPDLPRETRLTLAGLEGFSKNTGRSCRISRGRRTTSARRSATWASWRRTCEGLFRDLPPLIRTSRRGLPASSGPARGRPVLGRLNTFLPS